MKKVIDAEFEYVAGPMRVGDEHPTQKGWFYTGEYDRKGVLLWYRPPGPFKQWVRRIAIGIYLGLMALGIGSAVLFER